MDSGICEKRLRATLEKFGGVLKYGKHGAESGECCALELLAEDMGLGHTDSPRDTHTWDLRSLNDMNVPDDVRTEHLIPVLAAYAGSMDWDVKRQMEVSEKVLLGMFRKVIAQYIDDPKTKQQFADVHSVDTMIEACNDLARARDIARARARALALDLALDLARDLALDLARDLALDRARALDKKIRDSGFALMDRMVMLGIQTETRAMERTQQDILVEK